MGKTGMTAGGDREDHWVRQEGPLGETKRTVGGGGPLGEKEEGEYGGQEGNAR